METGMGMVMGNFAGWLVRSAPRAVKPWVIALGLLAAGAAHGNLITNGGFEAGNTGFGSDYAFGTTGGSLNPAQTYQIINNPSVGSCTTFAGCGHGGATSYFDHTAGDATGLMMAVNGATNANARAWFQDVVLIPGAHYVFSFWLSSWTTVNPANLSVNIELGGQSLGTFAASSTAGVWQQMTVSFTADSILPSPQTLTIRDLSTAASGNDFALDDLSLTRVPAPGSLALLALGLATLGVRGRSYGA